MTLNRIDDLLNTTIHSSGRREDRQAFRSVKGYYAPRKDGKEGTDPIKRAKPKRPEGMSARQYRIWKKKQRKSDI